MSATSLPTRGQAPATTTNTASPKPAAAEAEAPRVAVSETANKPVHIKQIELVKAPANTPEELNKTVELTSEDVSGLSDTLLTHFLWVNSTNEAQRPPIDSLHGSMYASFVQFVKSEDPKAKLDDRDAMEAYAKRFVTKGGAEVRLAMKLGDWEMMSLQAASNRLLVKVKEHHEKKDITNKRYTLSNTGEVLVEDVKKGFFSRAKTTNELTGQEFKFSGGEVIDIASNTHLSTFQKKFLAEQGWSDGVNLNAKQLETLDTRIINIVKVKSDLYNKTGYIVKDVDEFNFIEHHASSFGGREYKPTIVRHFLGEATSAGATALTIIENQGKVVSKEVRDRVQEEIDHKSKDSLKRTNAEQIVRRLQAEIDLINKNKAKTAEQQEDEKRHINGEIARLQREYKLFGKVEDLKIQEEELKISLETARQDVIAYQASLQPPVGESAVDLLQWSAATGVESVGYWEEEWRKQNKKKTDIEAQLTRIRGDRDRHQQILSDFSKSKDSSQKKSKGSASGATTPAAPDPQIEQFKKDILAKWKAEEDLISTLEKSISQDKSYSGGTKTLQDTIDELNDKFTRRKNLVDSEGAKPLLKEYWEKHNALLLLKAHQTSVGNEISGLPPARDTADKINTELKKLRDKLDHVGELAGEDKTKIESLYALKEASTPEALEQRENRVEKADRARLKIETYDLEYDPIAWKDYPLSVLRVVQLIWGEDVLLVHPQNKELSDRVKVLMKSSTFLPAVIGVLETLSASPISPANIAAASTDGKFDTLTDVFQATASIHRIAINQVNDKTIEAVMSMLKQSALQTAVKTP